MRLIDADELIEHVWRDRLDSRERIADLVESMPTIKAVPTEGVPICQTGCKRCKREYNLIVGSCRLCARFYKDMYEGGES